MKDDVVSIIVSAIIIRLALIFGTTIAFWLAYFGGWLLSCFAGCERVSGLSDHLADYHVGFRLSDSTKRDRTQITFGCLVLLYFSRTNRKSVLR